MTLSRRQFLGGVSASALMAAAYSPSSLFGLLQIPAAVAQELPNMPGGFGAGRSVAIIGAGIAGLTAAYELAKAGFEVTVYEGNRRYGGRSLTVRPADPDYRSWYLANSRFVRADSYSDTIPAEVRGAKVGEQKAAFVPAPVGNGYFDLYFNAGPGRIPTHHTGVLHYCRRFGVEMEPYLFTTESNLLQADSFNGGKPVQFRQFRFDLRGYVAELAYANDTLTTADAKNAAARQGRQHFQRLLSVFGDLSPNGTFQATERAGYVVEPGAGTNAGRARARLPFAELVDADKVWPRLFNSAHYRWQSPLLQPAGGMDMIWQALLAQRVADGALRDRVRLAHAVTGLRYADPDGGQVRVRFDGPNGAGETVHDYVIVTSLPVFALELDTAGLLDDGVAGHLRSVLYEPAGKYGWQARTRFWEDQDVQIFGGISWTNRVIEQIWYPSAGYNGPTGILTGAYMFDDNPVGIDGMVYPAGSGFKTPVPPEAIPPDQRYASRWGAMDHKERTRQALIGGEALHPGFTQKVYADAGLSICWQNQPYQAGVEANAMPVSRPQAYERLIRPIDRKGRVFLAGDSVSYVPGWQEGAVRSAWWTVGQIRDHVAANGR